MCSLKKYLGCWVVLNKMFSLKKKKWKKRSSEAGRARWWQTLQCHGEAPAPCEPPLESSSSAVVREQWHWALCCAESLGSFLAICQSVSLPCFRDLGWCLCTAPACSGTVQTHSKGPHLRSANTVFHWHVFSYVFGVWVYFSWSITL